MRRERDLDILTVVRKAPGDGGCVTGNGLSALEADRHHSFCRREGVLAMGQSGTE